MTVRSGLQRIFGDGIGIGVSDPASPEYALLPGERDAVANAAPKRTREFAAGRAAARQALSELGVAETAIPVAADRTPVWPSGATGSISHSDRLCVAVVAKAASSRGIGLDVEENAPLSPDIWDIVLTPAELDMITPLPGVMQGRRAKTIFCIKEAAYKAQFAITGTIFDFQTLQVHLDDDAFRAEFLRDVPPVAKGHSIGGGYFERDGHFIAGAHIP